MLLVILGLVAALATHAVAAPTDPDATDDDLAGGLPGDGRANAGDPVLLTGDSAEGWPGMSWTGEPWGARRAGPCDCDHDALVRAMGKAPELSAIVAAAERAAGLRSDPVPGWRRRSRMSALVPGVAVRAGNSESWRDVNDPTVNRAAAFGVSLAWRLERIVFDPNEPRFNAYDLARRRERRRVAHTAIRAYQAWLEAVAAHSRDERWQLHLMQAQADLDALTDGWFSDTLAKRSESH